MKMTARQLFKKVPKYGLFLFECDNKTDICKSTQISDDKDNITEGRTVTVLYGRDKQPLKAKIIKLSGILKH